MRYFILNKPRGCITGRSDPEGRATVYDHVPAWYPALPHVGRLDYNTEGLLLFTDDGRLARAVLDHDVGSPVAKVYHVKVRPKLDDEREAARRLARLAEPLRDAAGRPTTLPAKVALLEHRARSTWVIVTIEEGRHHQVRRLCEQSDLQIVKLRRHDLGPISLEDLKIRWCRPLTTREVAALYAAALPGETPPIPEPISPPSSGEFSA